jgi:hypothetical protein
MTDKINLIQHSKNMKTLIYLVALANALTANAQNTAAYQNFIPGDYPVSEMGFTYGTAGWSFQPLTDVSVTALGSFDYLVSAQGPIAVGLWTECGTLLASQTITSGSTLVNECRYEAIPAIQLSPDQTYFVGAYVTSGELMNFSVADPNNGTVIMAPEIQLGMAAESSVAGFNFPDSTESPSGYVFLAPNFEFQPVPEPATLWLVGTGLLALLATRHRCRKEASPEC